MNLFNLKLKALMALMVIAPLNLYAYSPANHGQLTEASVALLKQCHLLPSNFTSAAIDSLVLANKQQDTLFNKAILWHFPKPITPEQTKPKTIGHSLYGKMVHSTTFNQWYSYLNFAALRVGTIEEKATFLGAGLHYLQDLTVPAHAIPIFHPKGLVDFDNFDYQQLPVISQAIDCDELTKATTANKLLVENQNFTLEQIKQPICSNEAELCQLTWQVIWPTAVSKVTGFGHYPCNRDQFGEISLNCPENLQIDVNPEYYNELSLKLVNRAVVSGAKYLYQGLNRDRVLSENGCSLSHIPTRDLLNCIAKPTFVLVHGTFSGGWVWDSTANHLRQQGFEVFTPSLSGLGEHREQLRADINLTEHINDIVRLLDSKGLYNVVLVGHSYGGMVVTAVAEQRPSSIAKLVVVDGHIPFNNDSFMALLGPRAKQFEGLIQGDYLVPTWVKTEQTYPKDNPHPLATYLEPIKLNPPRPQFKPSHFILTVEHINKPQLDDYYKAYQRAKGLNWQTHIIPADHLPYNSNPKDFNELLKVIAQN
ncbi:alpha/beta fold hydrolase [Paraferrimonas sp. SM1919]|uniref:alpha/beta fold hydrolase n=1 Tax=Paraferrimonas sp. SM1919 TaxID=2662263 RepID=UPI0013D59B74|nr:alpha/beta hydrolase [Paraferrimonas sp. SM1919]